jgi:hypothetical protein
MYEFNKVMLAGCAWTTNAQYWWLDNRLDDLNLCAIIVIRKIALVLLRLWYNLV